MYNYYQFTSKLQVEVRNCHHMPTCNKYRSVWEAVQQIKENVAKPVEALVLGEIVIEEH